MWSTEENWRGAVKVIELTRKVRIPGERNTDEDWRLCWRGQHESSEEHGANRFQNPVLRARASRRDDAFEASVHLARVADPVYVVTCARHATENVITVPWHTTQRVFFNGSQVRSLEKYGYTCVDKDLPGFSAIPSG